MCLNNLSNLFAINSVGNQRQIFRSLLFCDGCEKQAKIYFGNFQSRHVACRFFKTGTDWVIVMSAWRNG